MIYDAEIEHTTPNQPSNEEQERGTGNVSARLPTLEISKFNGDFLKFDEFWEQFAATIDSNKHLSVIEKFGYLKSYLCGTALKAIEGLVMYSANYEEAIHIITERFDTKSVIVSELYTRLNKVKAPAYKSTNLRKFADEVEILLQSLKSQGKCTNNELISHTIQTKLPKEMIMEISRELGEEWEMDTMWQEIKKHVSILELVERCMESQFNSKRTSHISQEPLGIQPTSAAALITAQTKEPSRPCIFCSRQHWSDQCTVFRSLEERKAKVKGMCFKCFSTRHKAKECPKTRSCSHCKSEYHHCSLCAKLFPSAKIQPKSTAKQTKVTPTTNTQAVQQLQAENKTTTKKIVELENQMKRLTEEVNLLTDTMTNVEQAARSASAGQMPFALNNKDTAVVRALTSASNYSISRDENNKWTETLETAFVPCDYVHKNLWDVGDFMINICTSQGVPSSLAKYKAQLDDLDSFTGNDVAHWSNEVNKDLTQISKHLDGLLGTINLLKKDLEAISKQKKELEKKMAEVRNDMKAKIDELKKESVSEINSVEKEKELLSKGKKELAEQLDVMKSKLGEQKQLLQVLETEKGRLESDLASNQANHSQVDELENHAEILRSELVEVRDNLKTSDQELAQEKAQVKSLEKQNELVQGRQGSLMARLEQLSPERSQLEQQFKEGKPGGRGTCSTGQNSVWSRTGDTHHTIIPTGSVYG